MTLWLNLRARVAHCPEFTSEDKRVYSIHQNDSKNYALTKDQFVAHIENQDNGFDFDFSAYRLILGIIEKIVAEADRKNLGQ